MCLFLDICVNIYTHLYMGLITDTQMDTHTHTKENETDEVKCEKVERDKLIREEKKLLKKKERKRRGGETMKKNRVEKQECGKESRES